MKPIIVAPLKNDKDSDKIINSPANEFFAGIIPVYWQNIYGSIGINRRDSISCNFISFNTLKSAISEIHNINKKIYITLNNHYYSQEQNKLVERLIEDCIGVDVDGFIIADPGMISLVRQLYPTVYITASSESGCYSCYDVRFFASLGVNRIIFPRDMTISQMHDAISRSSVKKMEYEAFIYGPRCTYSGPYCTVTHGFINGPSFCSYKIQHRIMRNDGAELTSEEIKKIENNFADRNSWSCNHSTGDITSDSCGLCSVNKLLDIGINYFKIVGREYSILENLNNIDYVNDAIMNRKVGTESQISNICNDARCRDGLACYYAASDLSDLTDSTCETSLVERTVYIDVTEKKESPLNGNGIEYAALWTELRNGNLKKKFTESEIALNETLQSNRQNVISRIYFGNEFCENKLPSVDDIELTMSFCINNGIGFTLLLPPMSTKNILGFTLLLEKLASLYSFEVVCNSWGTIESLHSLNGISLIMGRLLNKIKHDPFISWPMDESIMKYKIRYSFPNADQGAIAAYFQQSNIGNEYFDSLLAKYNIERVETDLQYQNFGSCTLSKSLYFPIQYVTSGRYCLWSGLAEIDKHNKFRPLNDCVKPCSQYFSLLKSYDSNLKLYSHGNAVFVKRKITGCEVEVYDRYIFEESLPN